jgi:hypothetical protein
MLGVTGLPAIAQSEGCQLILSNPSLEFGRINLYEAKANDSAYRQAGAGPISIGKQLHTLQVICSEPTRFALRFRAAADDSNLGYRMGKRGVMLLKLTRAQADGHPVLLTVNPAPVVSASNPVNEAALLPNQSAQVVFNDQISSVTNLSVQVEIEGKMDVQTHRLKSDRDFSAEGFFEVVPL